MTVPIAELIKLPESDLEVIVQPGEWWSASFCGMCVCKCGSKGKRFLSCNIV